jgi:hypothetical protein
MDAYGEFNYNSNGSVRYAMKEGIGEGILPLVLVIAGYSYYK